MGVELAAFSACSAAPAINTAAHPSAIVSDIFNAVTLDHDRQSVKRPGRSDRLGSLADTDVLRKLGDVAG